MKFEELTGIERPDLWYGAGSRNAFCKHTFLIIAFLLLQQWTFAQQDLLKTPLTFKVQDESLLQTMSLMAEVAGFSFAYNSNLIPIDSLVSYQADQKPLDLVLQDLLGDYVSFSAVGSHIVLKTKKDYPEPPDSDFKISGQVVNANSGESLKDVVLYSETKFRSDLSDESGNYKLKLSTREKEQVITFSKIGFRDSSLTESLSEIYNLDIALEPVPYVMDTQKTVEQLRIVQWFTNSKQRLTALNIKKYLPRFAQASLVPALGTNSRMSGAITNNLSLNVVAGYNGGVKGFELGLGVNIIRGDVQGFQVAGVGNNVGGNVKGVQASGVYNIVLGNMDGLQMSTGLNYADSVYGAQFAALGNIAKSDVLGLQAAAGFNFNLEDMKGVQLTSGVNFQKGHFQGMQTAAGVNYADSLNGMQMAVLNLARKEVKGMQLGVINYAKNVRGVQFGILNIADSVRGIPIGLLSFVRKGYTHLDVYGDELNYLNLSLRTGVSHFHNIITAGASYDGTDVLWRVGYGLGTEFELGKKKRGFTSLDATVSYINKGNDFITDLNLVSMLNWDFGFRFKKHVALFVGPTLKVYNSKHLNSDTNKLGLDIAWNSLYRYESNGLLTEAWVGVRGGFRF